LLFILFAGMIARKGVDAVGKKQSGQLLLSAWQAETSEGKWKH
jgi:hypothetical protein